MTEHQLRRRSRARWQKDEAGFTVIETMVALVIVFAMLVSLAYVVTSGLRYQAIARERQQATGLANQLMEQIRGLAYERITQGLLSTDLTGDPNVVSCSGTYRLISCSAGSVVGSGEAIVSSPGLTTTTPLVPHRSATAPNSDLILNGRTYSWSTYVSQDDSDSEVIAPYRVTVLVTWANGAIDGLVRLQSLFWSPDGCKNKSTHPFAAPCQAFYYGQASAPNGSITVDGTLAGAAVSGSLILTGAEASVQHEQLAQASAGVHATEATLTDGSGTRKLGGVLPAASADSDPGTPATPEYDREGCGYDLLFCTLVGAPLVTPSTGGQTTLRFTPTTTDVGDAIGTSRASGAGTECPLPTSLQTDLLPCAGGRVMQKGTVEAVATLDGASPAIGSVTVARVLEPAAATVASVDRITSPAPIDAFCNPAANSSGCIDASVNRTVGTLSVGGLPNSFPGVPTGWTGFFLSIVGYQDSATASVGSGSLAPSASAVGDVWYFDQATNAYKSVALDEVGDLNEPPFSWTQSVGGSFVKVDISMQASEMISGSTVTSPAVGGELTTAEASVTSPIVTIQYTITKTTPPESVLFDVTIQVNLGTLQATGIYAPEPVAES